VVASSARFSIQALFIINNLVTAMSPYAKTKESRIRILGYPAEGERLRNFTTTGSKRSLYRTIQQRSSKDQGIVTLWSSCSTWIPGKPWRVQRIEHSNNLGVRSSTDYGRDCHHRGGHFYIHQNQVWSKIYHQLDSLLEVRSSSLSNSTHLGYQRSRQYTC
jgi:hypothetical protein